MDENYHWAFDDVDFCLSIKYNLNKQIVYCGKTNIFHEESASLKKNPVNKMFMGHNWNLLRSKWSSRIVLDKESYTADNKYNIFNG
jgi:GT2 family glycosyltransferase